MLKPLRLNLLKRRLPLLKKMHADRELPKSARLQAKKAFLQVKKELRLHGQ